MAEKPEKKADDKAASVGAAPRAAAATPDEKKATSPAAKSSLIKSTPFLLGVVMVIEAAILFLGFKMFGGSPKSAHGADLKTSTESGSKGGNGHAASAGANSKELVEVSIPTYKAINNVTGRSLIYDVSISILVKPDNKDALEASIKKREKTIQDRIRTIIAQSDPDKLGGGSEPGLETFRRQVKYRLEEIVGEGMIEEVLVPTCIPRRGD